MNNETFPMKHKSGIADLDWISLGIPPEEFNLNATLNSGQAFRWIEQPETGEFLGTIGDRVWRLRQAGLESPVAYHRTCATSNELTNSNHPEPLYSYFRLETHLPSLLSDWLHQDSVLASFLTPLQGSDSYKFLGLRLLHQDVFETIVAFITSANNNVPRISKLLTALSRRYGKLIKTPVGASHAFPTIEALAKPGLEEELRNMGFGYRAKYIPNAARIILANGGEEHLLKFRQANYEDTKKFLLTLPGVGNKVADCICLSCMEKLEVVPVDVHISRAAILRGIEVPKTLTDAGYRGVSQKLSKLWTPYAGWAQVIAFSIHLHALKIRYQDRLLNPLSRARNAASGRKRAVNKKEKGKQLIENRKI